MILKILENGSKSTLSVDVKKKYESYDSERTNGGKSSVKKGG